MDDPTQVPPFYRIAVVENGVVIGFNGQANTHWATENGAVMIPDGLPVTVGWLFDGQTFTDPNPTPETLPVEGTTDDPA